ncbi:MAG: peptidoglycan-binding protein [Eubacteriales bacterium]|nr:peptidoglycan-binding protein [Eubacteriales bacterium]
MIVQQSSFSASLLYVRRTVAIALVFITLISSACLAPANAETVGTLTARVVLRKSTDQDSTALQTLPDGEKVTVLSVSGNWYKVRYGSFTGYVLKNYVNVSSNSVIANAAKITALGDVPGALYPGDQGSDVKKLQKALKILGYYTLSIDGSYGDGTKTAVALYQQVEKLEADGIAGKATITAIFGSCANKADITVSGRDAEVTVSSSSSTASSSSSSSSSSSDKTVSSIAEIGSAPSASKEGDSGTKVVKLQQALELLGYYSGTIDGNYGAKTITAVKRFQKNRNMKEDGIAGASTLRVLFGTKASSTKTSSSSSSSSTKKTYTTEVLDWFADNVSSVIPKKATFTIKDVRTGKTFTAKRWSGINHLDAEPATAEDTAIMKKIFGGAWSWNRRPILILYRGHVYAASMNGMPHGTTTIDNNNFDGHFCIHFKNSKTHGTEKVDAGHQQAVTVASKASW